MITVADSRICNLHLIFNFCIPRAYINVSNLLAGKKTHSEVVPAFPRPNPTRNHQKNMV